jgi:hypothetical protein
MKRLHSLGGPEPEALYYQTLMCSLRIKWNQLVSNSGGESEKLLNISILTFDWIRRKRKQWNISKRLK